jgi:hypothetical protein
LQPLPRPCGHRQRFRAGAACALGPWGVENPTLRNYYEPLWSYLEARGRGELPAGALRYAVSD